MIYHNEQISVHECHRSFSLRASSQTEDSVSKTLASMYSSSAFKFSRLLYLFKDKYMQFFPTVFLFRNFCLLFCLAGLMDLLAGGFDSVFNIIFGYICYMYQQVMSFIFVFCLLIGYFEVRVHWFGV